MLGIDLVVKKLFASQEGVPSVELLVFHNTHFGDKFYTATNRKQLFKSPASADKLRHESSSITRSSCFELRMEQILPFELLQQTGCLCA